MQNCKNSINLVCNCIKLKFIEFELMCSFDINEVRNDYILNWPLKIFCSAGTGLLSMMAARAMGLNGTVTACESYLPMAKLMRKVLHRNSMGKAISLINKRSDELEVGVDIPSRADVLVSISFGCGLIDCLRMLLVIVIRKCKCRLARFWTRSYWGKG